jgi:hypothetical protein
MIPRVLFMKKGLSLPGEGSDWSFTSIHGRKIRTHEPHAESASDCNSVWSSRDVTARNNFYILSKHKEFEMCYYICHQWIYILKGRVHGTGH